MQGSIRSSSARTNYWPSPCFKPKFPSISISQVLPPCHGSSVSRFRHRSTAECRTAALGSPFQCSHKAHWHRPSLPTAQPRLSACFLRMTQDLGLPDGLVSWPGIPQSSVVRPTLLLCPPNMPAHTASFFKASSHPFCRANCSTTAAMSTYPDNHLHHGRTPHHTQKKP